MKSSNDKIRITPSSSQEYGAGSRLISKMFRGGTNKFQDPNSKILPVMIACLVMSVSSCNAADNKNEAAKGPDSMEVAPIKAQLPPEIAPKNAETSSGSTDTNLQIKNTSYDFSDSSSWNLTVSAWEHMSAKDYDGTFAYARKCLELYEAQALEMARSMTRFASPGREDEYATVNDVATAHYIMGEAYMKQANYGEAVKEFDIIIARYPFSQCWDPKGWFWKVAEVSKKNLDKIEKMKTGK